MSPELIERLKVLREYHASAMSSLIHYADDSGLRPSDVKHYRKKADIHAAHIATLDSLIAMSNPLDEYRGEP